MRTGHSPAGLCAAGGRPELAASQPQGRPRLAWRGSSGIGIALLSGVALLAAACSGADGPAQGESTAPVASSAPTAGTALTVSVSTPSRSLQWTVTCDPPGGTHPRPKSACDFLELAQRWGADPFEPVPADAVCSQQYGGPETATVTGTWNGRAVDASFNLTDGCEISRWNNAVALLAVSPSLSPSPSRSRRR